MSSSRQTIPGLRPRLVTCLAALGGALAIAACGSSGGNRASNFTADGLKFSACMRAHGLANFPDPTTAGHGFSIHIGPGSGLDPFSPAFRAAQKACRKLLPGGGPPAGTPSPQARAQMLAISTCMRAHGISDFPDPTTSPPTGAGQFGAVLGRDGVFLAIPSTVNQNSPAFKRAAGACHFG